MADVLRQFASDYGSNNIVFASKTWKEILYNYKTTLMTIEERYSKLKQGQQAEFAFKCYLVIGAE